MRASDRNTAHLVGWLFIGTFVFSIPGYLLYGPLLDHPKYILGAGHDTQIAFGALQFAGTGAEDGSLLLAGQTLVAFHDATFLLGPGFCAGIGNGIILGYLMYASGLLPRRVAMLGLIAGPLAFVAASGALLGVYEPQSSPQMLLTIPEMIWELTFGLYLIVKGFASTGELARGATAGEDGTFEVSGEGGRRLGRREYQPVVDMGQA